MSRPTPEHLLEEFLESVGVIVPEDTPERIVRFYHEFFVEDGEIPFQFTTFPNESDLMDMVAPHAIPFYSMCEHHLLPFFGVVHIGYLPHERIVGLSKLARVVDWYAHRPQLQERLTHQVASFIEEHLRPKGLGVVIDAQHLCMAMRGVAKHGATTTTSAIRGAFMASPDIRSEFFRLIGR